VKSASAGLIAHLNAGRAFKRAELWTFTLAGGAVARFTPLDRDVKVGADTWSANGPNLERPASTLAAGLDVDTFTVTVRPRITDLIAGLTWPVAARLGLLRFSRLLIERVYMPDWGDVSLGKLYIMGGWMGKVSGPPTAIEIEINSDLERLNVKQPLDVFQPQCRHTLFDAGCGLSKAAFKISGTVTSGSTVSQVNSALGQPADWFALGQIVFTSGALAGVSRVVKSYAGGAFQVIPPLPSAPVAGAGFDAFPGCDKLQATCTTKFNNLVNFGAEPYTPAPETAA
jgi:uncharacterized phage protein (TIGR02218 family)